MMKANNTFTKNYIVAVANVVCNVYSKLYLSIKS